MNDHEAEPAIKFKRRKTTHTKRTRLETEAEPTVAASQSPDAVAEDATTPALEGDGTSLALKEILRNRKRPRDRLREAAARAELTKTQAIVLHDHDAPKQGYTSRFVPQTGQVVDRDDEQMYVCQLPSLLPVSSSIPTRNMRTAQRLTSQYGIRRSPIS
jgi:hypothetical protein